MSDIRDNVHHNDIHESDLGKIIDGLESTTGRTLQPHEVDNTTAVIEELIGIAIGALDKRMSEKGFKAAPLDNMKLRSAKMGLQIVQKYGARFNVEARLDHFVSATNKSLPTLVDVFGEQALIDEIRPYIKEPQRTITLLDTAGATEAANLVRKSTTIPTPQMK